MTDTREPLIGECWCWRDGLDVEHHGTVVERGRRWVTTEEKTRRGPRRTTWTWVLFIVNAEPCTEHPREVPS